jgi:uncharacterized membrane protein (UPF0127 family)
MARVMSKATCRQIAFVMVANTPRSRMVGLLGRDSLPPASGIILDPCRMIHTWFMRFPIDVVFVGSDGKVVKTVERLGPFRLAWGGFDARTTIELGAGAIRSAGLTPNDYLLIEPQEA